MKNNAYKRAQALGYEVKMKHHHRFDGGVTTRVALIKDNTVLIGESKCHPKDQFSRKIGRERAVGQLLKGSNVVLEARNLSFEDRKELLDKQVFNYHPDKHVIFDTETFSIAMSGSDR